MVMRNDDGHVLAYQLVNEQGQNLGTILMPREEMIVGPQAGTVLLRRDMPRVYVNEVCKGTPARAA